MEKVKMCKPCFFTMGVYDVLLGLAFALFFRGIYRALGIELPNHPGYIFVPALFLVSGGVGEFLIARDPLKNTDLVIVRTLMKMSYATAVFYCHFRYGVPLIFTGIAVVSLVGVVGNLMFLKWAKSKDQGWSAAAIGR